MSNGKRLNANFYTYLWLREDGSPYYVGKGVDRRAFRRGSPPHERVILQEWPSEELAFEGEMLLIAYYGRIDQGAGCLRNRTDGGEGASGRTITEAELQKRKGFRQSSAARHKMSERLLGHIGHFSGRTHTEESLSKMRDAAHGRAPSTTACSKGGLALRGSKKSQETRVKMAAADKSYMQTALYRLRCSEAAKRRHREVVICEQ